MDKPTLHFGSAGGFMSPIYDSIFGDCWLVRNPCIRKLNKGDKYFCYMLFLRMF